MFTFFVIIIVFALFYLAWDSTDWYGNPVKMKSEEKQLYLMYIILIILVLLFSYISF